MVEISSGTHLDLRSVKNKNIQTIYITGGDTEHGIILISGNGGNDFTVLKNDFQQRVNEIDWMDSLTGFIVANNFKAYSTTDNGETWIPIWFDGFLSQEYQTNLYDITCVNDSTIYFCGGWQFGKGVICKSVNKGKNWNYTPIDHELRSIKFFDTQHGICVGYGAILYTDNGGLSWNFSEANDQFWTGLVFYHNIAFACSYNGAVIQSIDLGHSWSVLRHSNTLFQNTGHLNTIHTVDAIHFITAGNNGNSFYSDDNGDSWKIVSAFDNNTINTIEFTQENSGICVGNEGKIFLFHQ